MCILHIVICISLYVCNGTVYMLIVSALSGARSQELARRRSNLCRAHRGPRGSLTISYYF